VPVLKPDEILRYLTAKGFLSSGEAELASNRWSVDKDGPLLQFLGREKLLPTEVVEDLITLISHNQLEGLEPRLPGLVLLNRVGRGGRGSVYRAWQPSLKRVVAVKLLSRALSDNREYIQRFLREARVASKVQHRNIVRAYDINKKGAHVYMVMEYVSGVSLGQVLRKRATVETPDALEIARAVGDAVGYIAKVGLVHRDIKPDNIMIDVNGRVKLCDLGLARPSGATNLTQPMVAQGTPAYMSPEAAVRPEIDTQADVYSLGVTLYRMLLGKVPFDNSDPVEILRMQVEEQPRGLDGGELPGALADLIRRMLEKEPASRPHARDLAAEITALQKTLPGMDKPKLWELVPGGEPTIGTESDDPLSLDDNDQQAGALPPDVPRPWEDPATAPRPAAVRPKRPVTGIGLGTLSVALFLAIIYILVVTLSGPPEPPDDPRVPQLEAQLKDVEADLATERSQRRALTGQLLEAADRLIIEEEQDARNRALKPPRQTTGDIMDEIADMREASRLSTLPGGE
jgi:serine/threonine protein kinase